MFYNRGTSFVCRLRALLSTAGSSRARLSGLLVLPGLLLPVTSPTHTFTQTHICGFSRTPPWFCSYRFPCLTPFPLYQPGEVASSKDQFTLRPLAGFPQTSPCPIPSREGARRPESRALFLLRTPQNQCGHLGWWGRGGGEGTQENQSNKGTSVLNNKYAGTLNEKERVAEMRRMKHA